MKKITNRREFFSLSLRSAAVALLGQTIAKAESRILSNGTDAPPFEMVVVGDSIMWGQGLPEEQKFYYLVKQWLEKEAFGTRRQISSPIVEAHSGATIYPGVSTENDLRKKILSGETNVSNPCIIQQVENARKRCQAKSVAPESVGLVLVNGGINDLTVEKLLNPLTNNTEMIKDCAMRYCGFGMRLLLNSVAQTFPNAKIVVTGYYPIISEGTSSSMLKDLFWGLFRMRLKTLLAISRSLIPSDMQNSFERWLINRLTENCSVWVNATNRHLQATVNAINSELPHKNGLNGNTSRAYFVPIVFNKEHSYAGNNTYLWKISGSKLETDDPLFRSRDLSCKKDGKRWSAHFICHRAGAGHPNTAGAAAYAKAITETLSKEIVPYASWN